ncbi:MAG: CDP-diacylglycerol--serine O-phosphatidyltransferase [Terriglobia bacterium]
MKQGAQTRRQRRGIYLLPSFFTVLNLLCGYFAILSTMKGSTADLDNAAKAIGFAILFDTLDGRVARMSNTSSPFGREFDSLADIISFGIAPAFLALAWGLKSLDPVSAGSPELVRHVYQVGWIVSFFFLICGAWRLARFNIHSMNPHPHDPHAHRYFVGVPIPAAAGLIAAVVHALKTPVAMWYWGVVWLFMIAGLCYLMVSPIRYYSFKDIGLRQRHSSVLVIGLGILVLSIWFYSEYVLLALAVTYIFSGITAKLTSVIKRHVFQRAGAV